MYVELERAHLLELSVRDWQTVAEHVEVDVLNWFRWKFRKKNLGL
jgi:hypothetical protein